MNIFAFLLQILVGIKITNFDLWFSQTLQQTTLINIDLYHGGQMYAKKNLKLYTPH